MLRKAVFLLALPLFGGGFWLQMGTPDANPEARSLKAALVVRATGCHDPAGAEVSGVAVRFIDGHKQTDPLKLVSLKEPGTFAVMRDWPSDAAVTLEFVGHNAGMSTSMLVQARGDTVEKGSAKFYPHPPTAEEELASLRR
jgi:hypothetical protein